MFGIQNVTFGPCSAGSGQRFLGLLPLKGERLIPSQTRRLPRDSEVVRLCTLLAEGPRHSNPAIEEVLRSGKSNLPGFSKVSQAHIVGQSQTGRWDHFLCVRRRLFHVALDFRFVQLVFMF
jgi:hypothetical protein